MAQYRKEGNFEKPASPLNGARAMLLALLALIGCWCSHRGAPRPGDSGAPWDPRSCSWGGFSCSAHRAASSPLFGEPIGPERAALAAMDWPWAHIRKKVRCGARTPQRRHPQVERQAHGNPCELRRGGVWRVEDSTRQALRRGDDSRELQARVRASRADAGTWATLIQHKRERSRAGEIHRFTRRLADTVADAALRGELQGAREPRRLVKVEESKRPPRLRARDRGAMLRRQQAEAG